MTLPEIDSELRVALDIWPLSTFLIHLCRSVHIIKHMDMSTNFLGQVKVLEDTKLNWELAKDAHFKSKRWTRPRRMTTVARLLQLLRWYLVKPKRFWSSNFMPISYPTSPISVRRRASKYKWNLALGQTSRANLTKNKEKTWESFLSCATFHLLMVFRSNDGEAVKYCITNTPNSLIECHCIMFQECRAAQQLPQDPTMHVAPRPKMQQSW